VCSCKGGRGAVMCVAVREAVIWPYSCEACSNVACTARGGQ